MERICKVQMKDDLKSIALIESMKEKGFTYLGKVEGNEVFCNLENKESIKNCLEFLKNKTGEEWDVFEEPTKNLVFYKPDMYSVSNDGKNLHFNNMEYADLPLNCKSCAWMFSDLTLEDNFYFRHFDTSCVENMIAMFFDTEFPSGFSLGNNFSTEHVVDMSYMFNFATLPEYFSLGDKFYTKNVTRMLCMFSNVRFPKYFNLGDKFYTDNVQSMCSMFKSTKFNEDFYLPETFKLAPEHDEIFRLAEISDGQYLTKYAEKYIVSMLKNNNKSCRVEAF